MTTYAYHITLNDRELILVETALKHYRSFCESELADKPTSRRLHLAAIDDILRRLVADARMTSTSSFCWPKNPKDGAAP
jgi:hypothetical protein